jgi:MFS family permease
LAFEPADCGYFAGFVIAAFYLGRVIASPFWGELVDNLGRKPVLFLSIVISILFVLFFCLAERISVMVILLFALGSMNGTWVIFQTLVNEVYPDAKDAKRIYSLGLCLSVGGPFLGNAMSSPHLPQPYLCGGFLVGILGMTTLIMNFLYLDEPLHHDEYEIVKERSSPTRSPKTPTLTEKLTKYSSSTAATEGYSQQEMKIEMLQADNPQSCNDLEEQATLVTKNEEHTEMVAKTNISKLTRPKAVVLLKPSIPCFVAPGPSLLITFVSTAITDSIPIWLCSSLSKGGLNINSTFIGAIYLSVMVGLILLYNIVPISGNNQGSCEIVSGLVLLMLGTAALPYMNEKLLYGDDGYLYLILALIIRSFGANLNQLYYRPQCPEELALDKRGKYFGLFISLESAVQVVATIIGNFVMSWALNNNVYPSNIYFPFFGTAIVLFLCLLFALCAHFKNSKGVN